MVPVLIAISALGIFGYSSYNYAGFPELTFNALKWSFRIGLYILGSINYIALLMTDNALYRFFFPNTYDALYGYLYILFFSLSIFSGVVFPMMVSFFNKPLSVLFVGFTVLLGTSLFMKVDSYYNDFSVEELARDTFGKSKKDTLNAVKLFLKNNSKKIIKKRRIGKNGEPLTVFMPLVHDAIRMGEKAEHILEPLMSEYRTVPLNYPDANWQTPLIVAISYQNEKAVKLLLFKFRTRILTRGNPNRLTVFDENHPTKNFVTPYRLALQTGNANIIKMLRLEGERRGISLVDDEDSTSGFLKESVYFFTSRFFHNGTSNAPDTI